MYARVGAAMIIALVLAEGLLLADAPAWAAGGFGSLAYLVVVTR
jgi:hypothetical protein